MSTQQDKLAESLAALKKLQDKGIVAIQTKSITRTHRERLVKSGFIKEVMKGWYIPACPDEPAGERVRVKQVVAFVVICSNLAAQPPHDLRRVIGGPFSAMRELC